MQTIEVVYRHRDFIIIHKPCGISVHKDNAQTPFTTTLAKQLGVPKLWLVHRLDKVTSGLLILALNAQSAVIFGELFRQHKVQKTYLALACHKPKKKQGLIIGDMQKARRGAWKLTQSRENPAITRFISQSLAPNLRLFTLFPQTGKTHQLRVAMKSLGSPILGDSLYGGAVADRVYLHAYQLSFEYNGEAINVTAMPKCGEFWANISLHK